jgi:Cu(I)/Ag(I) efflux system periplasmic protein CusF
MKHQFLKATVFLGFSLLALNIYAAEGGSGMKMDMGENMKMEHKQMDSSLAITTNEGEVKAVDKANKNITLKHGPIKSKTVEMAAMTMSFPVQQASLLSNIKVGDKVKFNIENVDNVATVISLTVQK